MEYLDFLDENEPLDGVGVISDDDGCDISLPSDVGREISGTEGESEAKSSDGKSLATRVTMAMIRRAFLEVHVEEELLAEFGDEDDIEDVEDESVEQEGPLGEGLGEAEVEQKVEEEALVAETLLTGTQPAWATMMLVAGHTCTCVELTHLALSSRIKSHQNLVLIVYSCLRLGYKASVRCLYLCLFSIVSLK